MLKLEELEKGKIYHCRLSGKLVLVTHVSEYKVEGGSVDKGINVSGIYYNDVRGEYEEFNPWDHQLEEVAVFDPMDTGYKPMLSGDMSAPSVC